MTSRSAGAESNSVWISGNKKGPEVIRAFRFGGAEEDRTPDLRIANATLSQLSYRPK